MKNKWITATMGLLVLVGLCIVAVGAVNSRQLNGVANRLTLAQPAQVGSDQNGVPDQPNAAQVAGNYFGTVKLNVTVAGVFSDTLTTPPPPGTGTPAPPELGSIDLSLQLSQTGSALSGYVALDRTLIFSVVHTLGNQPIGPYLSGSFDGTNLTLQSEPVVQMVSGRAVQRQFRLTGTSTTSDGRQISGEYRETLWGYTSTPITVIGSFSLQRPVFDAVAPATTNQAPVTIADRVSTAQDKAITINVLGNDSDPNNDALTLLSVSKPQFGAAVISGQSVIYTPQAGFNGEDTFSYVVSDGKGESTAGSVTVVVGTPPVVDNTGKVYMPVVHR